MGEINKKLLLMKDEEYKRFQCTLMPTVDKTKVIGVRTPALRKLAKELYGTKEANEFLSVLPHGYYEENNLHAFIVEQIKDFDACIKEIDCFLPYVDNWATCDSLRPKCFVKNKEALLMKIDEWISSSHTYTVRFGIEMLMLHFLQDDKHYSPAHLERCVCIKSEDYYVNMMLAWFFSTALAFRYEDTLHILKEKKLSAFVHNKAIRKAVESFRVPQDRKEHLRTLALSEEG